MQNVICVNTSDVISWDDLDKATRTYCLLGKLPINDVISMQ